MPKIEFEVSELLFARLSALAVARNEPMERIAEGALDSLAGSSQTRQQIRKARRKAGNSSLADLGWLEGYAGQSLDELMAYEGSETPIVLLMAIEQAIQERIEREGKNWSGVERTVLSVMALHREVNNGGFDQFFRNSSLQYGQSIVDDLKRIGAKDTAPIARRAVAALKLEILTPVNVRSAMSVVDERRDEALQECDEAFYKLNEIPKCLFGYIRESRDGIYL